jgi:hypothetical protein
MSECVSNIKYLLTQFPHKRQVKQNGDKDPNILNSALEIEACDISAWGFP